MERTGRMQLWRTVAGGDIDKQAELANTYDMPAQHVPTAGKPPTQKAVIRKVASVGNLVDSTAEHDSALEAFLASGESELESGVAGEQPASLPQMGFVSPHVDVTSQDPPKVVQEKKAQHYALPDHGMYPLDSYVQVKRASQYFQENYKFMPPADRHEYCMNLVKRASALDIMTSPLIEKYGSAGYAGGADFDVCLGARKVAMKDPSHQELLDKLAMCRDEMEPEVFACALEQLDKVASIEHLYGGDVPDAYYTTFGKTAAELQEETDPNESIVIGNEYLTRRRLAEYCQNNVASVSLRFGAEVGNALAKGPNDLFDTLPRDQKLVLMRMANNDDSAVQQGIPTA